MRSLINLPDTADIAIWSMVIASLLPWLFAALSKKLGGFTLNDNEHPRQFLQGLTGRAARANAVQQNSYETLPVFLASILVAMLFFVPQPVINSLAVLYVVIRVAYGVAYIVNLPTLRSILSILGMICCIMLFYLAIRITTT